MLALQLHKELIALSHSLKISDELLEKGNRFMQKIFLLLQKHSTCSVDRCRLVGGVGKKTSLSVKFDYDCVIYVNKVNPPFEQLLDEWDDIFTCHLTELKRETKRTPYSVQFEIEGFEFDILPAPNYADSDQNTMLQAETIWEKISKRESASEKEKLSKLYSSGLSELALEFITKQSAFIHDLCRLAKFWNRTILFDQYLSGRSSIIEYLAVKAGQEEEQAAINDKLSILRAFRRFLEYFTRDRSIGIVFYDFYDKTRVSIDKKPYLIDPSNPYNNLLADIPSHFLPTLAMCSRETLNRLDQCEKNFNTECEKLFDPQPNLQKLFEPHINVNSITSMISSSSNCKEQSPRLIVRREKFDSKTLDKMKQSMGYVLTYLTNMYKNMIEEKEEVIAEKVKEAAERFVDRSFYEKNYHWKPTTQKHEDCDVTFILPINTKKQYAVYISMIQ